MDILTENQITEIEHRLTSVGVEHSALREELLDHVCCATETAMFGGKSFEEGCELAFSSFGTDGLQQVQQEISHISSPKNTLMFLLKSLALTSFLSVFGIVWMLDDPPSRVPIDGQYKVSSSFGMRMHPIKKVKKFHSGIDLKAEMGTPVVATSDGVVEKAGFDKNGYGNYILIRHDEAFQSKYSQLSEINVEVGQQVNKGDRIGAVGSSGRSTGPHLHYEVLKNGARENPTDYMQP